jgi:phosphatidylglycerol lysyltransferase
MTPLRLKWKPWSSGAPRRVGTPLQGKLANATVDSAPVAPTQSLTPPHEAAIRRLRLAMRFVPVTVFALALWAIHQSLIEYHYRDIAAAFRELPSERLLLALAITSCGYLVLAGYDLLGFRYIGRALRWRDLALASFISNALGNNLGNILVTGAAVRYWIYTSLGISAQQIARVVLFCSLGFWLGFLALGALLFIGVPIALPDALHLPAATMRPTGFVLLVVLGVYLVLIGTRRKPLRLGAWQFSLPSGALTAGQLLVASLDLCLMGLALYVLLPVTLDWSYPHFMAIFLLALFCGTASQVPGGFGVLETVVLLLSPPAATVGVAAALLAFRGIYYVVPLFVATAIVGVREKSRYAPKFRGLLERHGRWVNAVAPWMIAGAIFFSGAVLLFSGALPAAAGRLERLHSILALPVIETSHFMASLVGAALLLVAYGIQRRLDAAYLIALALLAAGSVLSLTKGWDYEEAIVLGATFALLLPLRRHFYRKASFLGLPFKWSWIASAAIVLAGSAWLAFFAHAYPEYSSQTWWQFAWQAEAARSLRAAVGATSLAVLFAAAQLLRPMRPTPALPGPADIDRAGRVAVQSVRTCANLVFRGDKALLFSKSGNAFLMYGRMGRSWIAMGDPIGPEDEARELRWQFHELCDRFDGWCVFFEVRQEHRDLYAELGLALTQLGEEARVALGSFSLEGPARRDLRHSRAMLVHGGCRFEILRREAVSAALPALARVSDAWLARKATSEKGFSNASFDAKYLTYFPLAVIRKDDEIIAFANLWLGAGKEELSVDLMRHLPDAPNGTMDFLFTELLLWGRQEGYRWFNFGMAPLSGLDRQAGPRLWHRFGNFVYRHGEHFYNFHGLRRYKEKFDPVWTPLYLASPGGIALAAILIDVTALIAGGVTGIVLRQAHLAGHRA